MTFRISTSLAAIALSTCSIPALAADGSCESSYTKHYPPAAGQFYSSQMMFMWTAKNGRGVWPLIGNYDVPGPQPTFPRELPGFGTVTADRSNKTLKFEKRPYPTAYRPGFSGGKANVWKVPAGESAYPYYWPTSRIHNYPKPLPYGWPLDVGVAGWGIPGYTAAEADLGIWPGHADVTPMIKDGQMYNHPYPPIHPDPHSHAVRYVFQTAFPQNLKDFNYTQAPDINVSDADVLAAARANAAMITDTTMKRLGDYVTNGRVDRPFLDLKPGVTVRHSYSVGDSTFDHGRIAYECALFAEMVKHPRLEDVHFLKYFIRTWAYGGLGGSPYNNGYNHAATYIAYAPYVITTNQAPELRDDAASTNYRTPLTFNLLANDSDPDEGPEPLKVTAVTAPSQGSVTWQPNGSVTYTPAGEWMGEVVLDYTATDGAAEETAKLRITVNDAGLEPVAGNDVFVTTWDKPITLQPLSNDVVPDMGAISITAIGAPARGSAMINSDRHSIRYIPVSGMTGSFSFPYTISDTKKTSSASITVIVREPDQNRSDWDAKPFNYEDWCRSTTDGKPRQGGYSDDCWKMMRDTKPIPN